MKSSYVLKNRFLTATTLIYANGITVAAGVKFATLNNAYYEPGINNLEHLRLEYTLIRGCIQKPFSALSNLPHVKYCTLLILTMLRNKFLELTTMWHSLRNTGNRFDKFIPSHKDVTMMI